SAIPRPIWAASVFLLVTAVIAAALLILGWLVKPAGSSLPYLAAVALAIGVIAFVVALPPIERDALQERLRTLAQITVALIFAAIATRTSCGPGTCPGWRPTSPSRSPGARWCST